MTISDCEGQMAFPEGNSNSMASNSPLAKRQVLRLISDDQEDSFQIMNPPLESPYFNKNLMERVQAAKHRTGPQHLKKLKF